MSDQQTMDQGQKMFLEFQQQQIHGLLVGSHMLKGQLMAATSANLLPQQTREYLYTQFLQMAAAVEVKK